MESRSRSVPSFRRQTVAEAIAESLRERILGGQIPGGTQLRQDAVAADYDVSRIPVREALRQLEAEGLVIFYPHRGAVVSELSLAEIGELFEVRALLEPDLLGRALPKFGEADRGRASEILEALDKAIETEDVTVWGQLNWQFHSALYEPAGRPCTLAIVQKLHNNTDRYSRLQLLLTRGAARAQKEHRQILKLCRKSEAKAACALLERHILGAGNALVEFLTRHRSAT